MPLCCRSPRAPQARHCLADTRMHSNELTHLAVPLYFTHASLAVSGARCDGPGAHLTVDGLALRNAGWKWQALNPAKPMTEEQAIRRAPAPCTTPRPSSTGSVARLQLAATLLPGAWEVFACPCYMVQPCLHISRCAC
jgi:hypothetical protein